MAKLVADIRTGDFDYRLLKPVDAQVVAVGQHPDPWRSLDVVVGAGVIGIGVSSGGLEAAAGGPAGRRSARRDRAPTIDSVRRSRRPAVRLRERYGSTG